MRLIKSAYTGLKSRFFPASTSIKTDKKEHYMCHIPDKIGFLPSLLLKLLFSKVEINRNQADMLRVLDEEGHVVFVNKRKTGFALLFTYFLTKKFRRSLVDAELF